MTGVTSISSVTRIGISTSCIPTPASPAPVGHQLPTTIQVHYDPPKRAEASLSTLNIRAAPQQERSDLWKARRGFTFDVKSLRRPAVRNPTQKASPISRFRNSRTPQGERALRGRNAHERFARQFLREPARACSRMRLRVVRSHDCRVSASSPERAP